jgi:hypothetical protein
VRVQSLLIRDRNHLIHEIRGLGAEKGVSETKHDDDYNEMELQRITMI